MKTDTPPPNLDKLLRYNPRTGKFHWIVTTHGRGGMIHPGDEAGTLKDGYINIKVEGTLYRAHRLAWFIMTGVWLPASQDIDHENGNRSDNSWDNIRKATRSLNLLNLNNQLRSDNTSGHRGVGQRKDTGRWWSRLKIGGKFVHIADYDTEAEAIAARQQAERQYLK